MQVNIKKLKDPMRWDKDYNQYYIWVEKDMINYVQEIKS